MAMRRRRRTDEEDEEDREDSGGVFECGRRKEVERGGSRVVKEWTSVC